MKKSFPGFYNPSDDELKKIWKSKKTLFVFDTNTLLNLYGYATLTKDDFFTILSEISDQIWIPYHVILEYQRRRLAIIRNEKAIFPKIDKCLNKIENIFTKDFKELELHRRFPSVDKNTKKLHDEMKKLITNYKRSVTHWDKKQPCVRSHDSIREKLHTILDGKIGEIPKDQEWLNEIYKKGEKRYENKVPPGYKDNGKENNHQSTFSYSNLDYESKYGDLIIWNQLLEKAKDKEIDSIILVTDDAKEDWWYIIDSNGKKKIGPRAELREEICRESTIKIFEMYNTSNFLDNSKTILKIDISDESINDASDQFIGRLQRDYLNSKKQKPTLIELVKQIYQGNELRDRANDLSENDKSSLLKEYESMKHWSLSNLPERQTPFEDSLSEKENIEYLKKLSKQISKKKELQLKLFSLDRDETE